MAKHGVLYETDGFIKNCINRAGISESNIDGGALVAEGALVSGDHEVSVLTFAQAPVADPASAGTTRVGICYSPSIHYDVINGKRFPAKSEDDRDYYNIAGDVVDYFFPEVGVEFGVTMANIKGTTAPTKGQFLEIAPENDGKFVIKNSQTANTPSFEVRDIIDVKYPSINSFADDIEKVYIVATRFNG